MYINNSIAIKIIIPKKTLEIYWEKSNREKKISVATHMGVFLSILIVHNMSRGPPYVLLKEKQSLNSYQLITGSHKSSHDHYLAFEGLCHLHCRDGPT